IYVAPPNYHLMINRGRVALVTGPRENLTRPAINPLFRSAAATYDGRVTGVILTGLLDDGVAGLAEIKRHGGVAVVQGPATALFPTMPSTALQQVPVDFVASLEELPDLLTTLATTERENMPTDEPIEKTLTDWTCPECRGPLWEERQGRIVEFRCR